MRNMQRIAGVFGIIVLMFGMAAVASAKDTLTFWSSGYSVEMQDWLKTSVFPEFEQKYNVTVQYAEIGWGGPREEKLTTAYAGGVFPDVYVTGTEAYAMPLDSLIATWPDARQIDRGLYESRRDPKTGNLYIVPQMVDMTPYAYNKRLFMEAGLNPAAPQSWDELLNAVKRTTKVSADAVIQSGFETTWNSPYVAAVWDHFVLQSGGSVSTPDARKSIVGSSNICLDALKMVAELYARTRPTGYKAMAESGFARGQVAISRGLTARLLEMTQFNPADVEHLDVFALKRSKDQRGVSLASVNGLSISNQTKKTDLAWEFVKFMMSNKVQTGMTPMATMLAVRRDVAANSRLEAVRKYLPWYNIMDTVTAMDFFPNRGPVANIIVSVLQGKVAPETALEQMHQALQATYDAYWNK